MSFCAIIYPNKNSLQLFCENSNLNSANFTELLFFCVKILPEQMQMPFVNRLYVNCECIRQRENWFLAQSIQIFGSKLHISSLATIGASPVNVFNTKEVSHWFPDMRIPKVLLHSPKKWIFGPKTAKFGPKLAFWAKYRHFWPIWSNAWPKKMRTSCLGGFLLCWYQNFYLLP